MSIREKDIEEQKKACLHCEKTDSIEGCIKIGCPYHILQNYDEYEEKLFKQKGLKIISNWRVKV